jgi:hypothetical protein
MKSLHHILLDICKYLMMQSSIWQMVHTRTSEDPILDFPEGFARRGHGQAPRGNAPPPPPCPPVSLEQLLAAQNDLMRRLVENDERHGVECQQPRYQERDLSYSDFLSTHLPVFSDAPWSPCLDYFTVQSIRRLYTQHNNSVAQLEPGGLATL